MEENKKLEHGELSHEKVVLEKQAKHVGIIGPYTKRELRKLLLSSTSLLPTDEIKSTKGSTLELVDDLKEDKADELGKDVDRTLEDVDASKDTIRGVIKRRGAFSEGQDSKWQKEDESVDGKKDEKTFEDLLRELGLSGSLIRSLLENGLTDEYIRLLKALGLTDEDIARLMKAYESTAEEPSSQEDTDVSCASSTTSFDGETSPESRYLKSFLSKALPRALRDMASKKPYDPVEYLGHWLLNFKICEEREKKRKEYEMELMLEREKYRMMNIKERESVTIESGGEEFIEDWNFINYVTQ